MEAGHTDTRRLEPRQLRYVLAVGELRSLHRAAAFLALTPGVLSREITRAEAACGARLFDRLPGRVVPTPAGRELVEMARHALARHMAEARDELPGGTLRVGWMDYGRGQRIQRAAIAEFQAQHPHVRVQLVPAPWRDQLRELSEGTLNVGFYIGPRPELPGLSVERLLSYTVDAAMLPSAHRLAHVSDVSLAELNAVPLHSIAADYAPETMATVHDRLARAGWRGRMTSGSPQPSTMLTMVACGAGWSPTMTEMSGWVPPGVTVVPLADGPLLEVDHHAVWRDDVPQADAFVRLVFELRSIVEPATPPPASRRAGDKPLLARRYAERARIARDLHDALLQDVLGCELQLEALRRRLPTSLDQENRQLQEVIERLERVAREGREAVKSLGPVTSSPRNLAVALSLAAESLRAGSPADFRVRTTGTVRELAPRADEASFRVGVEAITNALLHASPALLSVTLRYSDDLFRLRIADDGVGIAPEVLGGGALPGQLGLAMMRERAAAAGATLAIRSGPGAGTVVEMVMPGRLAFAAE